MARQHEIEVKVEQGKLTYEVTTDGGPPKKDKQARVFFKDNVRWIYRKGALACLFKLSPFKETVTSEEPGVYTKNLIVKEKYVAGGNNTYSYFVAVVVQPDGIPLSEDPEIIVDEDPRGIPPTRKR